MHRDWPDIVGIGSTVYDTLMVVESFPTEDTKSKGLQTKVQGGGPCATALVAAAKLGVSAAYLGTMGNDPFGDFMVEDLEQWGVDTCHVRREQGAISFHAVVLLNQQNGSRTCIWNPGTVQPPMPNDIPVEVLRNAKALHLDGHMTDAAEFAAQICREAGVPVSYDAGGLYPGIERLLPLVDYLIPSEEFALAFTGAKNADEAIRLLFDTFHPKLVVLTQGVRGGLLYDGKQLQTYESYPLQVQDSNGCGDTFHGAFMAAIIRGLVPMAACQYASAAAAIKCTRLGAREGMPTDAECRAFLRERGVEL